MSSFLVISPCELSQSAFKTPVAIKKKVKSRPKKGWSSKKKKRYPKKSVAVDDNMAEDSYPTVDLVDDFTDTVKFNEASVSEQILSELMNDPVFHCEKDPQIQLGGFMVVSPTDQPPSDPIEPTSNNVDPLSTNLDSINLDPDDNAQSDQSNDLVRFFLFERKNGESLEIPLNSSGDKQVASLLQKALAEVCSNKIGEVEFQKKNEWIINWRKLRYPDSKSSDCRAVGVSARNVLDYDRIDDAKAETYTPATLAYGKIRERSASSEGPTLPRAKVSYNNDGDRTTSNVAESPIIHDLSGHKRVTDEAIKSTKPETRKGSTDVPSSVPERSLVARTSRIPPSGSGKMSNAAEHKTSTIKSTTLETRKNSADVPFSVLVIDDNRSKSQNKTTEQKRNKKKSTKAKTRSKTRHSHSKKKSSSKSSKTRVDMSNDQEKLCLNPTNPEGELAACEKPHGNSPSSSEIPDQSDPRPNQDNPDQDQATQDPLVVACSPEDDSSISLHQSFTPDSAIQGEPAQHEPRTNCTSSVSCSMGPNDSHPLSHQSPTSCNTLTISGCPGEKLHHICRPSGRPPPIIGSCPCINSQELTSPPHTSTNCNLVQFCSSSVCVHNNARGSAHSVDQQKRDENAFGRSSESPQEVLSCQFHKLCQPAPQQHMSGFHQICSKSMCSSNCNMNPFSSAHTYKRYNYGSCHKNNAFSKCGKACVDMYGYPSVPVCRAIHPVGPQVHATCQHQTCQFSQYSPFNKCECADDSPFNLNTSPSGLPNCMPRKVEHASKHHFSQAPSTDHPSKCCETCRKASFSSMDNGQNHLPPMISSTWRSRPRYSVGEPCHSSQPPFVAGNTTKFVTYDDDMSCENGSSSFTHQAPPKVDAGPQNLKIISTHGATDKSAWPSTFVFQHECDDELPVNDNGSVPFESNCMHNELPCLPVAPSTSRVPSTRHLPRCCSKLLSDSVHPAISHSPGYGQEMCPPVTSQVCQNEQCHLSGSRASCSPPVKVKTAKISALEASSRASSSGGPRFSSYDALRSSHTIESHSDEIGFHNVGSYPRNPTTCSSRLPSVRNRKRPLDIGAIAVTLQNDPRYWTDVSTQSVVTSTQIPTTDTTTNNRLRQPGCPANTSLDPLVISSDDDDPEQNFDATCKGRPLPENTERPSNTIEDIMVISSDDDDTEQNFDATSKGRPLPENTGQSSNTIDDLMVISSDDDLSDEAFDFTRKHYSLPANSGQSTNKNGQPGQSASSVVQHSMHTAGHRFNGCIGPIAISSDDEQ